MLYPCNPGISFIRRFAHISKTNATRQISVDSQKRPLLFFSPLFCFYTWGRITLRNLHEMGVFSSRIYPQSYHRFEHKARGITSKYILGVTFMQEKIG